MRLFSRRESASPEQVAIDELPILTFEKEGAEASASIQPVSSPMSEVTTETPSDLTEDAHDSASRVKVVVHRLDGGLDEGESDSRRIAGDGFPVYSGPDATRARIVPTRDIKYVVFGSVDDPDLQADPGDASSERKAVMRFRD